MEIGNPDIKLKIGSETFSVMELHGQEGLSRPYRFVVDIIVIFTAEAKFLGQHAELELGSRKISGIITETNKQLVDKPLEIQNLAYLRVQCVIEPILMLTRLYCGGKIFNNKTVPEIITTMLQNIGYRSDQIKSNSIWCKLPKPSHIACKPLKKVIINLCIAF